MEAISKKYIVDEQNRRIAVQIPIETFEKLEEVLENYSLVQLMKEKNDNSGNSEMKKEYDFSSGVRGKHYKAYREGHTVRVHREDGTVLIQHFTQEDGAIMLDPDVKTYFPDAESVNKALRSIINQ